jgi:hypothetical protein
MPTTKAIHLQKDSTLTFANSRMAQPLDSFRFIWSNDHTSPLSFFNSLMIATQKMSLAHPKWNTQAKVFNKTVKKSLALSCNTSYHSTIATMTFKLLFGERAWVPSFPNEYIQQIHDGETSAAERFNLLQKICKSNLATKLMC